jgi:predicted RNA-binding Zn-ribbon protein involved in translation (DUF1610 family)
VAGILPLHRTLDQELVALLRGASLECLCCGEFVMHARGGSVFCPECGAQFGDEGRSRPGSTPPFRPADSTAFHVA